MDQWSFAVAGNLSSTALIYLARKDRANGEREKARKDERPASGAICNNWIEGATVADLT